LKKTIDRFEIFDTYQNALGKFPDAVSAKRLFRLLKRVTEENNGGKVHSIAKASNDVDGATFFLI